jgi:predicted nucleic acid-binding protein
MSALADTTVLVDHLRGSEDAQRVVFNVAANGRLSVSRLTLVELASGMRAAQRRPFEALMKFLDVVEVDELIGVRAQELAREWGPSHRAIDAIDYVIAATAEHRRLPLLTTNVKHFPMFDGLAAPY